jgi:serine/threonine-protein kinase
VRRLGASGNTTASRVKTLYLHVESHKGRAEADAFLGSLKLEQDYLDDESRALSREVWHAALEHFTARWGRREIQNTLESVIHPENLGVFARVVRGATGPEEAFNQLDHYGGDEVLTERWVTVASDARSWRGAVPIHPDSEFERDGLFSLARAAELAAIPLLFGLPPAKVEVLSTPGEAGIEFLVRWRLEDRSFPLVAGAGISSLGGAIGLLLSSAYPLLGGVALGTAMGVGLAIEGKRRVTARAQMKRLQVLERAATLREIREQLTQTRRGGSVIAGQYRLERPLGAGAIGTIWEAVRLSDGMVVAIKLLRIAVAHDSVAADRLRREAGALGLAWHPNVVEIHDEGYLADGTCFLVMERLRGESLDARLESKGALDPEEVLPIALEVCDALIAVHAAGVVHRDLKPSNVFLASGGERGERVKILDFGIARVEWAEPRLTMTGMPMGTPGYMSPEQEQGVEIDGRSDIYAFGALLYRCLTGAAPPEGLGQLLADASAPNVEPLLRPLPERWRKVVERATRPLPRDRYPDARALRDAIASLEPTLSAGAS